MSRGLRKILIFLSVFLILILGWYAGMSYFYSHPSQYYNSNGEAIASSATDKVFIYGTSINNQNCTGMTAKQVDELLIEKNSIDVAQININGEKHEIKLSDLGYVMSYSEQLNDVINKQNAFLWPVFALGKNEPVTVEPTILFDETSVNEMLDKLGIVKSLVKKEELCITLGEEEEGYYLNTEVLEPEIKVDETRTYIKEQLQAGASEIIIDDSFYVQHVITDDEKKLIAFYEDIDKFQNKGVTYTFGKERKTITKHQWAELLNTGTTVARKITANMIDSGIISFDIDKDKANQFMEDFLDEYNTWRNQYFTTTSGETVYIPTGYYGNKIDVATEQEWFAEFVTSDVDTAFRTPIYLEEHAKYKEKDNIGNTYVEISIDEQHMWYYKDGKLFLETDVTTGAPYHGGTPTMVVEIQNRIRNKTLVGPNYRSFVKYWMGVNGSYGIHDASWR